MQCCSVLLFVFDRRRWQSPAVCHCRGCRSCSCRDYHIGDYLLCNMDQTAVITIEMHRKAQSVASPAKPCHPLANVVKINPVPIVTCCTHSSLLNSGVTGRKLSNFYQRSSPLL